MFDLVLSGGEVILPNKGQTPCDIGIANGKIESLVPHGSKIKGKEVSYLVDRLKTYRAGTKVGPNSSLMIMMAQPLSDAEIDNLAAYLNAQK